MLRDFSPPFFVSSFFWSPPSLFSAHALLLSLLHHRQRARPRLSRLLSRLRSSPPPTSPRYIFTAAFSFEMIVKMIAMGIWCEGSGTYLREIWNWIDFIVVVSAWLQMVPGIPSVVFLRVIRVLRPLRSLNSVPRLKALIEAILGAMPQLFNILVLIMLMFLIFGILGIQLFVGVQHRRCRHTSMPVRMPAELAQAYDDDMQAYTLGESTLDGLPFLSQVVSNRTAFPYCAETYGVLGAKPLLLNDDDAWKWSSSPWHTPQQCAWPHVVGIDRVCSVASATATLGQCVQQHPSTLHLHFHMIYIQY